MKKLTSVVFTLTLCAFTQSSLSFSNLIVFGDSLSDNGNFPESPTPYVESHDPHIAQDTSASFYVPFSNPVDTSKGSATPPLPKVNRNITWPQLNPTLLADQVPISWQQQQQATRRYRSLSWNELLLAYANALGISASSVIVPSFLVHQRNIPQSASINYAWGSALAATGCFSRYYKPWSSCNRQQIWQKRQQYMQSPTRANRLQLRIPALANQVDFFLQDLKTNNIHVDSDTVYAFWVGGNNMINSYNQLLDWHPIDMLRFIFANPTDVVLQAVKHITNTIPAQQLPKTMYVFNLMDPSLTPSYYGTKLAPLATALSSMYNFWSTIRVDYFNLTHKTKVKIVPVHDWYKEASHYHYFKKHLGQSYQVEGGDFTKADSIPSNREGFMYWNDVHPSVDMHKITAYRFLKSLD